MIAEDASRDAILAEIGADADMAAKLDSYVRILEEWQQNLSLIGPGTLPHIWQRHIMDSAQLMPFIKPETGAIMDVGSGAGFPGLVLAILYGERLQRPIQLVESDGRKCRFLKAVANETGANVRVTHKRIEDLIANWPATITARAVAPLDKLLNWTSKQHHPGLTCVFMKGKKATEELTKLENYQKIHPTVRIDTHASITHPDGVILRLSGFQKTSNSSDKQLKSQTKPQTKPQAKPRLKGRSQPNHWKNKTASNKGYK
ncbi:MAG: 16S rRNA (guanine(527)-N(7))-methyltransferase RsmG [Alphaproteobacteria bacterium]|nr:16S rRNA (guanine(527)-N(7))-methyltransferase RsmG [Alphaproteobacteria bacterium]